MSRKRMWNSWVYLESVLLLEVVASFHKKNENMQFDEDSEDYDNDDSGDEWDEEKSPVKKSV